MNELKIILPLILIAICSGCYGGDPGPHAMTEGFDDDPQTLQIPGSPSDEHSNSDPSGDQHLDQNSDQIQIPGNLPAPISTTSTFQLVTAGFQSVDSGNHRFHSERYHGHGHVRSIAGHQQTSERYQQISPDLSIKK